MHANTHTAKAIPKVCRELMWSKAGIQCSAADLGIHSAAQGTAAVENRQRSHPLHPNKEQGLCFNSASQL